MNLDQPAWIESPTFVVDLEQPLDQRFGGMPDAIAALGRDLLSAVLADIPAAAQIFADAARLRTGGRFHRELLALCRVLGVPWREVMVANVSYDLTMMKFGCSTIALAGPDGPVVARNMDWWPEEVLAASSCLLRYENKEGLHLANAGWPGSLGAVTGLSGRGFAVVLNAVSTSETRGKELGYPVMLFLRRVLDTARDFDQAVAMLQRQRLAAPALITVVGSSNDQRVVIERTPTKHALRWAAGDAALIATNDYRELYQPEVNDRAEIYQTTCHRFDYLTERLAGYSVTERMDDVVLLELLTHPQVIQQITAQHVIARPREGAIRLLTPRKFHGAISA